MKAKIANRIMPKNLAVLCTSCSSKIKDVLVMTNGKGRMKKLCNCGNPHVDSGVNHTEAFIARGKTLLDRAARFVATQPYGIIEGASW